MRRFLPLEMTLVQPMMSADACSNVEEHLDRSTVDVAKSRDVVLIVDAEGQKRTGGGPKSPCAPELLLWRDEGGSSRPAGVGWKLIHENTTAPYLCLRVNKQSLQADKGALDKVPTEQCNEHRERDYS